MQVEKEFNSLNGMKLKETLISNLKKLGIDALLDIARSRKVSQDIMKKLDLKLRGKGDEEAESKYDLIR